MAQKNHPDNREIRRMMLSVADMLAERGFISAEEKEYMARLPDRDGKACMAEKSKNGKEDVLGKSGNL